LLGAGAFALYRLDPSIGAGQNWPSYGNDYSEQHFSSLDQINPETISRLGVAWSLDLPPQARGLEAVPLAVDGVLYFPTSLAVVYAVDAVTGKTLWEFDPQTGQANSQALRNGRGVSRGVAYGDGSIFVGVTDGRLIALDANTGKPRWSVDTFEESETRRQITSAPLFFKDKVIIGHAGADQGVRGYVTAYDAKTGTRLWRFYTVPGNPAKGFEDSTQEMAAKTWSGEWWKWGGGGTVWGRMTFDPELNRIYIGTGNASNYNSWQRSPGGGDNLFLASIVAVDADTGKYIWHYQVNPRESWDYKAISDMTLAELTIDGKPRKVLMQAPTNGFLYVIDRTTGRLISAEKLGKVTWAERIDLATGRPVEAPGIRYEKGPITIWPGPGGLHNWQPMAFSPSTGLLYVPAAKQNGTYSASEKELSEAKAMTTDTKLYWIGIGAKLGGGKIDPDDNTGSLIAWDPVQKKPRWTVQYPWTSSGGVLATAGGIVFQGTPDGFLHGYDAKTGSELWKAPVGNGIVAAPMTYSVDNVQYVTILAGYIGFEDFGWRFGKHMPRVVTFKLDGHAKLALTPPDKTVTPGVDPGKPVDTAAAMRGAVVYLHNCMICHGPGAAATSVGAPDLRESSAAHDPQSLRSILKDGLLAMGGMPRFKDMHDPEIADLQMYIRQVSAAAAQDQARKGGAQRIGSKKEVR